MAGPEELQRMVGREVRRPGFEDVMTRGRGKVRSKRRGQGTWKSPTGHLGFQGIQVVGGVNRIGIYTPTVNLTYLCRILLIAFQACV